MVTRELSSSALAAYGLRPRRVRPLARAVVRVDADDGRTYALRCRPRVSRVFGDIPLELAWTAALRRDTDISPPEAFAGFDGSIIQEIPAPDGGDPYDCVLFEWLPGLELGRRLTPTNLRQLGVLAARLHEHAATFRPPSELPVRTLHELIGRGEREVVFSHDHGPLLTPSRRAVFAQIAARYRQEVDALFADRSDCRVIHADLIPENVKIHRDCLRPLDFYEVIWGYPVQDLALTFYDIRFYVDCRPYGFAAMRDAYAEGYCSRLSWPEQPPGQIDALIAGRRLRKANWVLASETAPFAARPEDVTDPRLIDGFLERIEAEFRALLERGPGADIH